MKNFLTKLYLEFNVKTTSNGTTNYFYLKIHYFWVVAFVAFIIWLCW